MQALGRAVDDGADLWMFGFQRRFVRRCEWLSCMPNCGFLPQTSQTDAIADLVRTTAERIEKRGGPRPEREVSEPAKG